MGVEIERKFLISGSGWRTPHPTYICQGYLNRDKNRTVRVRVNGDFGVLTIKGITTGSRRPEFEYEIPIHDAKELLSLCDGPIVEKNRHIVLDGSLKWEVDEFLGDNEGLVIAEVELVSEDQLIAIPEWVGTEVTDDSRYFNSNLAVNPYNSWARSNGT